MDFNSYTDYHGFIHLSSVKGSYIGSANSKLYTSQAYLLDSLLGTNIFNKEDYPKIMKWCEVQKGLYCRHPLLENEKEQHDNDLGMIAAAYILGFRNIPKDIYDYGEDYGYCYNHRNIGAYDITCQRQGSHICFTKICADKNPPIYENIWLMGSIFTSFIKWQISKRRGNPFAQTALLSWMMLQVLKEVAWYWRITKSFFDTLVDIYEVAKVYYPSNHPILNLYKLAQERKL